MALVAIIFSKKGLFLVIFRDAKKKPALRLVDWILALLNGLIQMDF
jgi:hypothetical protein